MKRILIAMVFFGFFCSLARAQEKFVTLPVDSNRIFTMVEKMPEFPNGGITGFFKYLTDSLRYPERARERSIQGRVILTCVVEKDGSLDNVRILKNLSKETDAEAIRLITVCPKWIPGYQNGKPARVMCPINIPVIFRLPD